MQDGIPGQEEANKKISEEVGDEILTYQKQFPEYNWEALRDLCFSVVYAAKREWFTVGFYYAVELTRKGEKCIEVEASNMLEMLVK